MSSRYSRDGVNQERRNTIKWFLPLSGLATSPEGYCDWQYRKPLRDQGTWGWMHNLQCISTSNNSQVWLVLAPYNDSVWNLTEMGPDNLCPSWSFGAKANHLLNKLLSKGKVGCGWKLPKIIVSNNGLLMREHTTASFKAEGTTPKKVIITAWSALPDSLDQWRGTWI